MLLVFNDTFGVILWRSVLVVDKPNHIKLNWVHVPNWREHYIKRNQERQHNISENNTTSYKNRKWTVMISISCLMHDTSST